VLGFKGEVLAVYLMQSSPRLEQLQAACIHPVYHRSQGFTAPHKTSEMRWSADSHCIHLRSFWLLRCNFGACQQVFGSRSILHLGAALVEQYNADTHLLEFTVLPGLVRPELWSSCSCGAIAPVVEKLEY
jgi:hypothetical protein